MSERSVNRANARRLAAADRRASQRRRRAGLAVAGAAGAAALFAPSAQAATVVVTTTDDAPIGTSAGSTLTLRDALAGAADGDTVTFASSVTGTIRLTEGDLIAPAGTTSIVGPGAGSLSISGDADADGGGNSRILNVGGTSATTVSGLRLTDGGTEGDGGAAFVDFGAKLTLRDAALTDNTADGDGGAVAARGDLEVVSSTLSGNVAGGDGGAIARTKYFQGNNEGQDNEPGTLTVSGSVLSGNAAASGGAISFEGKYSEGDAAIAPSTITTSTLARNRARYDGGALQAGGTSDRDALTISRSTLSGNVADRVGGGIASDGGLAPLAIEQSTVTENAAGGDGGGVAIDAVQRSSRRERTARRADAPTGNVSLTGATVSGNRAGTNAELTGAAGGGIFLGSRTSYDPATETYTEYTRDVPLGSTVVSGNSAVGAPADLAQRETATDGGFRLAHSLVQAPGDAAIKTDPAAPSITGVDPQLGELAGNGGATQTLLPAATSALVDKGDAAEGVTADQRGFARTVDRDAENAVGGDGTDIGAAEVAAPVVQPQPQQPAPVAQVPAAPAVAPPTSTIAPMLPTPISKPRKPSASRQPITLRGTAGVGTTKVRVAVARKVGSQCRFLRADGTFGSARSCLRTSYVSAKGTRTWSYKLPKLAKGKYIVWSRAIVQTKIETKVSTRNFTRITIR